MVKTCLVSSIEVETLKITSELQEMQQVIESR